MSTTTIEITPGPSLPTTFTAQISQPSKPTPSTIPPVGLVEISTAAELIPGPPGAIGPVGPPGPSGGPDTPAQILEKIVTVDGASSNLDADLLDGQHGAYYSDYANLTNKPATFPPTLPIAQSGVTNLVADQAAQDSAISNKLDTTTAIATFAPLASPTFTGDPRAPTPSAADNDTSIATTAYVTSAISAATASGNYVLKTGDTMTGVLTLASTGAAAALAITPTVSHAQINLDKFASGSNSAIRGSKAGSARWYMALGDGTAESGGGVGSNFTITRYDDAGVAIDTPLSILRLTGRTTLGGGTGQTTAILKMRDSTLNATGNSLEWGHTNTSGYQNTLGVYTGSGNGFVGFNCEHGTNSNTIRTRGRAGSIFRGDAAGGFAWETAATATADNQTPASLATLNSAGTLAVTQYVVANASFCGNGTVGILAAGQGTGQAGTAYLRPDGNASAVGQFSVDSSGNGTLAVGSGSVAQLSAGQIYSTAGTAYGVTLQKSATSASLRISNNQTTGAVCAGFYNPNGNIGNITTTNSATAYNTSSDERLKTFTGPLSGDDAIAVIRADPARRFTWNASGEKAVGWGAQTSYEVSHDLATPPLTELDGLPKEPGEDGFVPWSMDQSKRTPYLWAALAAALDKIDALEARIAALEAQP